LGRRSPSPEINYHKECNGNKNKSDALGKGDGSKNHKAPLITSEGLNDQPANSIEKTVKPYNLTITFLESSEAYKNNKNEKGL
jgi:hypothetical protein